MDSLVDELADRGYLTANKLETYLKTYYPAVQVSYPTIIRFIKKGQILGYKIGTQYRIPAEEIARYVSEGTRSGGDLVSLLSSVEDNTNRHSTHYRNPKE